MPRKDDGYSLPEVRKQLLGFLKLLDREGLLENFSTQLFYSWFQESGHRGRNKSFHLVIPRDKPLSFTPVPFDQTAMVADISAICTRWGENRLNLDKQTVLVRLWTRPESGDSKVICRAHIDLATFGQSGPWSHLQFGGRNIDESEQWVLPKKVGNLRWPCPLYDIILACEFVIYSLQPAKWSNLCQKPEFVALVRHSEESYVRPFFETWTGYNSRVISGSERQTFLATLCNRTSLRPYRAR